MGNKTVLSQRQNHYGHPVPGNFLTGPDDLDVGGVLERDGGLPACPQRTQTGGCKPLPVDDDLDPKLRA